MLDLIFKLAALAAIGASWFVIITVVIIENGMIALGAIYVAAAFLMALFIAFHDDDDGGNV